MKKTTFYCDGCGRKLEGEDLVKSSTLATSMSKSDLFCPETCMAYADVYWTESAPILTKILKDASSAISNYRNKFFSSRLSRASLKEVDAVTRAN